ncbi:MAG: LysR family transcriptional regulator [Drouetiella hepatica Uher 2000/2452]|jgi:DNA-binding transcriptional LysR family regulator|uniref:LysR family transcriptional regulator n=1 Tax=Drouetiella hepatica Uher 2000/2452 TaxID=904376 RepID=A0A951Q9U7_9CYAN|nr:LysR family transcriptional regulator [Drouetiella hepatica Uher 2000/2452]
MKSIDLSAIDLNLLVAFEALLEERSVTLAAQRLHLGQPAVSAALGRLRGVFEDELFMRMGREMQPTSKALEIASGIVSALNQIRQTLETSQVFDSKTSSRRLAIGSSDYTSSVVLPSLLGFCGQQAPYLNFRLIGFEKDSVGDLLEQGAIDVALGVFPTLPHQTHSMALFQEHFVGIARRGHPAIARGTMALETFASQPHALVTLRRDTTGKIDELLAQRHLQRRVAITTPHMLALPAILAACDLVATVPYRVAVQLARSHSLELFELPIETEAWTVSMLWSKLADKDAANVWLRQTLNAISQTI